MEIYILVRWQFYIETDGLHTELNFARGVKEGKDFSSKMGRAYIIEQYE